MIEQDLFFLFMKIINNLFIYCTCKLKTLLHMIKIENLHDDK